jgi:hypothetical protein
MVYLWKVFSYGLKMWSWILENFRIWFELIWCSNEKVMEEIQKKESKKEKGSPTGPTPEPSKASAPPPPLYFIFLFLFPADRWDPPVRVIFHLASIAPISSAQWIPPGVNSRRFRSSKLAPVAPLSSPPSPLHFPSIFSPDCAAKLAKLHAWVHHCCGHAGVILTASGEIAASFWSPETPLAPVHHLMFPFHPISQQFDHLVLTRRPPPPRALRPPLRNVARSNWRWRPHSRTRQDLMCLVRPSASSRNYWRITGVHL